MPSRRCLATMSSLEILSSHRSGNTNVIRTIAFPRCRLNRSRDFRHATDAYRLRLAREDTVKTNVIVRSVRTVFVEIPLGGRPRSAHWSGSEVDTFLQFGAARTWTARVSTRVCGCEEGAEVGPEDASEVAVDDG